MSHRNDAFVDKLLTQCEQNKRCLTTRDENIRKALYRRCNKSIISPAPALFARKSHWEKLDKAQRHREIIRALALKHPDWTFCTFSAACLMGLEVSWKHLDVIHVCSEVKPSSKPGLHIQRHLIHPQSNHLIDGVRVTPPVQTVADCLMATGFINAMPIADSALASLKIERLTLAEEIEFRKSALNNHSIETARMTLKHADVRAESGGESVARAIMITTGFAPDHLQFELVDPFNPKNTMRSDFAWEQAAAVLTLGELDGLAKYTDRTLLAGKTTAEKLVQERQRESHLSIYGHPIVRFTMREARTPGVLPNKLRIAGIHQSPLPPWLNDIDL